MARNRSDLFFNLPKNWEEILSEIFMNGGTDIEAHLSLGISSIDHKVLMAVDQYADAFTNGMAVSEAYWMKWARETLTDECIVVESSKGKVTVERPKIDTKLFELVMKRMFAWDKKLDKIKEKDVDKEQPKKELDKFKNKYGIKLAK